MVTHLPHTAALLELDPESKPGSVGLANATYVAASVNRAATNAMANVGTLLAFADAGGRILVLGGRAWTWPELCEVLLDGNCRTSRAFPYDGVQSPSLAGISRDMLTRWNGLPGTVAAGALHDKSGKNLTSGTNLCWLYRPDWPVMAEVPTVTGKGAVLFAVFAWHGHLDRGKPTYDPVAERLLLNLLR